MHRRVDLNRKISEVTSQTMVKARADLDSHADTSCAGAGTVVIEYTNKTCDVSPFATEYEPLVQIPVIKAGTAYNDPITGVTYILILSQALYFGDRMSNTLICPNQLRANGLIVDDVPRHLSEGNKSTHSVYFPDERLRINLQLHGCISYIPIRTPTKDELEECHWIHLTSEAEWDPYSLDFARQEKNIMERDGGLNECDSNDVAFDSNIVATVLSTVSSALIDDNVISTLESRVMVRNIEAAQSVNRRYAIKHEELSRRWGIGLETATRTLKVTTQKCIRNAVHPLHRRYRTRQQQLRYNQLSSRFYSDTMFSSHKSIGSNMCGQVFVNDLEFVRFIPMQSKSDAGNALSEFIQDVGIPQSLHTDNAKEETMGKWKEVRLNCQLRQTETEPYSPWQNRAERTIREVKKSVVRLMSRTKAPMRLWDFCAVYVCETRCLTAHSIYSLHGRTPYECVTGNTPDISEYVEFDWYQPTWYYDSSDFPEERRLLGRWLGVSHWIGQAMCYWILPISGIPISRTTVQVVSEQELLTDEVTVQLSTFDKQVQEKLGNSCNGTPDDLLFTSKISSYDENDLSESYEPAADMPEADEYDEDSYDKYLEAHVILPQGDSLISGHVIGRKRDVNGNPLGISHRNPILDSRVYNVQFPDGHVEEYAANVIAESLYSQVDDEGNQYLIMDEIIDHRCNDTAVHQDDMYVTSSNGNRHKRRTTRGWELCIAWKDGT
ncbi:MAG: hypothetical protein ACRDL7_00940, partial [Gaiellaceae bacterium]